MSSLRISLRCLSPLQLCSEKSSLPLSLLQTPAPCRCSLCQTSVPQRLPSSELLNNAHGIQTTRELLDFHQTLSSTVNKTITSPSSILPKPIFQDEIIQQKPHGEHWRMRLPVDAAANLINLHTNETRCKLQCLETRDAHKQQCDPHRVGNGKHAECHVKDENIAWTHGVLRIQHAAQNYFPKEIQPSFLWTLSSSRSRGRDVGP